MFSSALRWIGDAWLGIRRSASDALGWLGNAMRNLGQILGNAASSIWKGILSFFSWFKFWFLLPVEIYIRRKIYNKREFVNVNGIGGLVYVPA